MTKTKKRITAVAAMAMAGVMALSGTFAWQSINQTAKNEAAKTLNPGGRLHDDFDGTNKDIYVENFTDPEDGVPIFARIRLSEYMEIGEDAGKDAAENKQAKSLVDTSKYDDDTTWTIHIPEDDTNPFAKYWEWTLGGETNYMPTFNKNKDSLKADINGTWGGTDGNGTNPYDDYVDYSKDTNKTKTDDEIYDADLNDVDEMANGTSVENVNHTVKTQQIHTVKNTQDGRKEKEKARVMTMYDWGTLPDEEKVGPYWVWDEDGWAYWAQPIKPGEATGLLLDKIQRTETSISSNWYYGINVEGQFITAHDLGADDNTGFYTDQKNPPTKEALKLLEKIGVSMDKTKPDPNKLTITVTAEEETVKSNSDTQFHAVVKRGDTILEGAKVTWKSDMGWQASWYTDDEGNQTGKMHAYDQLAGKDVTVTATYEDPETKETVSGTAKVHVVKGEDTYSLTASTVNGAGNVFQGGSIDIGQEVLKNWMTLPDAECTWTVDNHDCSMSEEHEVKIPEGPNGELVTKKVSTLQVGANVPTGTVLTVTATYKADNGKTVSDTVKITVRDSNTKQEISKEIRDAWDKDQTQNNGVPTTTVTIDDIPCYVMDVNEETNTALVLTKDAQFPAQFQSYSMNTNWHYSSLRGEVKKWLASREKGELDCMSPQKGHEIYTRTKSDRLNDPTPGKWTYKDEGENGKSWRVFYCSYDRAFVLSRMDMFGYSWIPTIEPPEVDNSSGKWDSDEKEYAVGHQLTPPEGSWVAKYQGEDVLTWQRSIDNAASEDYQRKVEVEQKGDSSTFGERLLVGKSDPNHPTGGQYEQQYDDWAYVRPAIWIELSDQ